MPLPTNISAYEDIQKVLERALESPEGIRVTLETRSAAVYFRHRCYKYRALLRESYKGPTAYDVLNVTLEGNVAVIRRPGTNYQIEEINNDTRRA